MINQQEIAVVTVDGVPFTAWDTLDLEYKLGTTAIAYLKLTTTEPNAFIGQAEQIWPGRQIKLTLGGKLAFNGICTIRNAHIAADAHDLHIVAATNEQLPTTSVNGSPGEYKNMTIAQIANAIAGKVGVNVIVPNAPGVNVPFPIYRETIGQDRLSAIETLARCRNLHLCSGLSTGTLYLSRTGAPFLGGSGSVVLVEGQNIRDGVATLQTDLGLQLSGNPTVHNVVSQTPGGKSTSQAGPLAANILTPVANPFAGTFATSAPAWLKTVTIVPELPLSPVEAQMRGNHEADLESFQLADALITVDGWFSPSGQLWATMLNSPATLKSPSLVPPRFNIEWFLIGVRHRQSNKEGSTTVLNLNIRASNTTPQI